LSELDSLIDQERTLAMKQIQTAFKETGIVDASDDASTTPTEIADRMNKIDDDELFQTMTRSQTL